MTVTIEDNEPQQSDPQPRELIVTLFGLYARAQSNWLPVAGLVRMMADLGVDGPAVRSSVSRLKRRDILISERHEGAVGYALSSSALEVIAEGDTRIFHRGRGTVEDGWIILVFSVPESERDRRHTLRTTLTRLGFGTVAPGVWIAPGRLARETREMLERKGLSAYAELFDGQHLAFGDLRSKVRRWWDLEGLTLQYAEFVRRHRPTLAEFGARAAPPEQAFAAYVPMLTEWRRLPYLDPGLPLSLLPAGWHGVTAEQLFNDLNDTLSGPAREHAVQVIHRRR
ncbi:PaaX family transcriptional regulator [Nocardia panacis]|uniref:PaaX family transcriptional regulator n=1 Tax=Nocardia panacis TaxID=2340916 RepID=A0A3A4KEA2_9NOCA|nr:PaaX family transcriptional regulator C-terminal domain-containing protein [Nocardia panacis]RJO77031.1 PaaX family transcriptional regulator [Nocardia panacis]